MLVEMRIASLMVDPNSGLPIILLVEVDGVRALPIVIGMPEAEAIALALQGTPLPRPRTHDLLRDVIVGLGGHVERMIVNDLRDSTFHAILQVRSNGSVVDLDSRPSDAMALTTRTGAPIYVDNAVLNTARLRTPDELEREPSHTAHTPARRTDEPALRSLDIDPNAPVEELENLLQSLTVGDFGKYKM